MSRAEENLTRRLAFVSPGIRPEVVKGLEQLPEAEIEARLASLATQAPRICFLVSTTFSDQIDSDGSNLHRAIRPADWWLSIIKRHFPDAHLFAGPEHETALILTWKPGLAARLIIGHQRRQQSIMRRLDRYRSKRLQRQLPKLGMSEADLLALLDGSTVALVGNSRGLIERSYGPAIDAHDIVIRCNRAPIFHTRSHGSRTDWIATSTEIPETLPGTRGASHILWMSARRDRLPAWLLRLPSLFLYPAAHSKALADLTGARPSTGMMVIDLLLRSKCAAIDLYGFDFFRSQSLSGSQTRAKAPHDFDGEERLVRAWAEEHRRLTINA